MWRGHIINCNVHSRIPSGYKYCLLGPGQHHAFKYILEISLSLLYPIFNSSGMSVPMHQTRVPLNQRVGRFTGSINLITWTVWARSLVGTCFSSCCCRSWLWWIIPPPWTVGWFQEEWFFLILIARCSSWNAGLLPVRIAWDHAEPICVALVGMPAWRPCQQRSDALLRLSKPTRILRDLTNSF